MTTSKRTRRAPWILLVFYVGATALLINATRTPNLAIATPTASTQQISTVVPGADPVADIAAAVSPAVVQISTTQGLGSGVIYDSDGLILTAAHVVEGVTNVDIRLYDGRTVPGKVLGTHEPTDIAVIKIEGSPDLPVAQLAIGADIRVGQLAVALGSPFGLEQTVTAGIVSAVDRNVSMVSMVQTDAAINPGNSGGPLVDGSGRVIGINDQIFTSSGGNDGIGFAISIDLAVIVADQIVAGQDVKTSLLGISTVATADVRDPGVLVDEVSAGSAAQQGGIEVGDVIVSFDGDAVADIQQLQVKVLNTPPGTLVDIDLLRNGERLTITATLGRGE